MPTPRRKPPAAIPPVKPGRSSPTELAKVAVARRAEPVLGNPDKLKLTVTLYLRRDIAERLTERAIRETRNLEDVMREILEQAADR